MRIMAGGAIALLLVGTAIPGAHANMATVELSAFLQTIKITNEASSTAAIDEVIYSYGTAGDGIATWDGFPGGTALDFLSDPRYFQTVRFGPDIPVGGMSTRGPGDIDLIETLLPLSVTGNTTEEQIVDPGISLTNAFVTINWVDGSSGTTPLLNEIWRTNQRLVVDSAMAAIPLPAGLPMLAAAIAALGLLRFGRRQA